MIKDDNKKEKMKKIIRENPDKTLNELKNMVKDILPNEEREQFTFEDLTKLISEINQEREREILITELVIPSTCQFVNTVT